MPQEIELDQDEWHIGDQVGAGGFARVYLAQTTSGERGVVKLIPKAPGAGRELLFEDLDGLPNVVPVLDRGEWRDFWVLAMPRAEKSLRDHLDEMGGRLSTEESVHVLIHVATALAAMEGRVVHRDIKPDNILLLDGQWCLADFGIARYAAATTAPDTRKAAMSPPYAAPEQWRGERASSATDVYSMGAVAHELMAGRPPFAGPNTHDYRQQHLEERPPLIPRVPIKMQSLMDECLYKSPQARPQPQIVLARLQQSMQTSSEAGQRLQQANARAVQERAETARQESLARSEMDRRLGLADAAARALERLAGLLHTNISSNAPLSSHVLAPPTWAWSLRNASLRLEMAKMAEQQSDLDLPFEVAAFSSVSLRIPADRHGYEGRAHSLWYCDAQEASVFRWFETAFMFNPLGSRQSSVEPFDLRPGRDAYIALSPVMHTHQAAWPFSPIDQGDEDEFLERWLGWFADAAEGNLRQPRRMPERDPAGSWRRGR